MDTAVRFMLASIALLAMVNHTHADTGRDDAEVVLEADEIDRSTVEVGAFVVVVYGQGERQPTSGEWTKLDTVKGYIKAVRQRSLILSLERYGWPESIALDRIQTLTLVESPALESTDRDSTAAIADPSPNAAVRDSMPVDAIERLADKYGYGIDPPDDRNDRNNGFGAKCIMGAGVGTLSAITAFLLLMSSGQCPDTEDPIFCLEGPPVTGGKIGFLLGTAFGVTIVDPYDELFTYLYALGGS